MRQIERTLCRRGWRGNRRAVGGILAVLSLVFFALAVTWQMEDSVAATMEEARLERYGAWECAAPGAVLEDWQDNRFIAEAGRVWSVGAIVDEAFTGTTAAVGAWNETAWSLGRLTLLRGAPSGGGRGNRR